METDVVPRAILFDLDGVLIDSYRVWFHLLNHTARLLGYPEIPDAIYAQCWGQSTSADRDAFFPRHSIADVESAYDAHYFEHLEHLRIPDEVPSLFQHLASRNIRTAVVTNTQASLASRLVERAGATPDVIVGGGDAARPKPAPDSVLLACERLDVPTAESWMVGDSVYDEKAAEAAGVFFVGVGIDGARRIGSVGGVLDWIP